MEGISETSISRDKNIAPDDQNGLPMLKKRKRSAVMHLLKVALCMLRLKSSKSKSKSIQVNLASKFSWEDLIGSMRPMHLQSDQSPPPDIEGKASIMPEPESLPVGEQTEEAITPPLSPVAYVSSQSSAFSISSYGSVSDMSQYESPFNLQEIHVMKPCKETTEEECGYDDDGGDEMIDAKAEEFIAHFYEQMRLQNLN
ncbi:uncharacterized protein LOC111306040 [Durio zibethinus]|uniref:Uncharacterized protein LOC111306040 n=1 Tax=Durio zibethinus TaxID=66656 RepID=A0A6P6A4L5_DURZI|nr:uncharacterized protein LOC111306040 [Durio zibethinus]